MTPHVSGWTEGMLDARARLIAENIERTARGDPPLNAIEAGALTSAEHGPTPGHRACRSTTAG